jgi:hypothetical protein
MNLSKFLKCEITEAWELQVIFGSYIDNLLGSVDIRSVVVVSKPEVF